MSNQISKLIVSLHNVYSIGKVNMTLKTFPTTYVAVGQVFPAMLNEDTGSFDIIDSELDDPILQVFNIVGTVNNYAAFFDPYTGEVITSLTAPKYLEILHFIDVNNSVGSDYLGGEELDLDLV